MPLIKRETSSPRPNAKLASELAGELRSPRESGQPRIEEEDFPTGVVRVSVFWDKWDGVADETRVATIRRAYEEADRGDVARRITLAIALTYPEAFEMGMLPFAVTPFLRSSDRVTFVELRDAMIAEGASILNDVNRPQLRFATREEAEACFDRLVARLPASKEIWALTQEASTVQ